MRAYNLLKINILLKIPLKYSYPIKSYGHRFIIPYLYSYESILPKRSFFLTIINIGLCSQISSLIEDLIQNLNSNLNLNQNFKM